MRQQLIPYFISSHPACHEEDMAELSAITKGLNFQLEQVQDFTPTPMTVATEIYYTGIHPYTGEKVYTAKTQEQKLAQRRFFFWYKPEERQGIITELRKMRRPDLIQILYPGSKAPYGNGSATRGSAETRREGSQNRTKHKPKHK